MVERVDVGLDKSRLYPLILVDVAGEITGTTRLHKLMFILQQEYQVPILQKFIKYHYGPFSSELREDMNFFIENGLIEQYSEDLGEDMDGFPVNRTNYRISNKGKEIVVKSFSNEERKPFMKVVDEWGSKPLKELIKHAKSLIS